MSGVIMRAHDQCPGLTERTIGAARSASGKSSYEMLRAMAGPLSAKTLVDLACGSGPLSELIAQDLGENGRLIGIDLNLSELQMARRRLSGLANASFIQADASATSLPPSSIDIVLCHMAFMLFNPPAPVVKELARILKSGGLFAAVVPAFREPSELFKALMGSLLNAFKKESPQELSSIQTIPELKSESALRGLFSPLNGFNDDIRIASVDVALRGSPAKLAAQVLPGFYSSHLLSPPALARVEAEWTSILENDAQADGNAALPLPLSAFLVKRL